MKFLPLILVLSFAFAPPVQAQKKVFVKYEQIEAKGWGQTPYVREGQELIVCIAELSDTTLQTATFTIPISPNEYGDTLVFNYAVYMASATDTAEYRAYIAGSMGDGYSATTLGYLVGTSSTYIENEAVQSGVLKIAPPFYPYYVFGVKPSAAAPTDIVGRASIFPVVKK